MENFQDRGAGSGLKKIIRFFLRGWIRIWSISDAEPWLFFVWFCAFVCLSVSEFECMFMFVCECMFPTSIANICVMNWVRLYIRACAASMCIYNMYTCACVFACEDNNNCSDRSMEVNLPALRNYDRQTNRRPNDRYTDRRAQRTVWLSTTIRSTQTPLFKFAEISVNNGNGMKGYLSSVIS